MRIIYKYQVPKDAAEPVLIPKGSQFLTLQEQKEWPVVYFSVDPEETEMEEYYFKMLGTGWMINHFEWMDLKDCWQYIGTVQIINKKFVFHIWMRPVHDA